MGLRLAPPSRIAWAAVQLYLTMNWHEGVESPLLPSIPSCFRLPWFDMIRHDPGLLHRSRVNAENTCYALRRARRLSSWLWSASSTWRHGLRVFSYLLTQVQRSTLNRRRMPNRLVTIGNDTALMLFSRPLWSYCSTAHANDFIWTSPQNDAYMMGRGSRERQHVDTWKTR